MLFDVRPTLFTDLEPLSRTLRADDVEEIAAASGQGPYEGLVHSFNLSDECMTIWNGNDPAAIFGYKVVDPGIAAVVWMLGSDKIFEGKIEFLKRSRFWVDYVNSKAPLIYNLVYHKNVVHIKWLRWMGFVFLRRIEKAGVKGLPFIEFARLNHV